MISIAVVMDNVGEAEKISALINTAQGDLGEETSVEVFTDSIKLCDNFNDEYDVMIIGTELALLDGMTLARRIRKTGSEACIILVSETDKYALEGYDVSASAYLLKPVKYAPFITALKRTVDKLTARRQKTVSIVIPGRQGTKVLPSHTVTYIEVSGHDVIYHTLKGDFNDRRPLKDIAALLEGKNFEFCNSCYLVNLKYVEAIDNNVVTVYGKDLVISRNKKTEFIKRYKNYMS